MRFDGIIFLGFDITVIVGSPLSGECSTEGQVERVRNRKRQKKFAVYDLFYCKTSE